MDLINTPSELIARYAQLWKSFTMFSHSMNNIMRQLNSGWLREESLPAVIMVCMKIFNEVCFINVKNAVGKALTENVNAERDG